LLYGINKWGFKINLAYANWELNPKNIHLLPNANVILFLTVYHAFLRLFGTKKANKMVRTIAKKCDILVFEHEGDKWLGRSVEYNAKNIDTNHTHSFTDEPDPRIRPNFEDYLPPGDYEIGLANYETSKKINVKIGESGNIVGKRPRVEIYQSKANIIPGEVTNSNNIDDVLWWYEQWFSDIFDDSIRIIEQTRIDYRGNDRTDIIYAIDVSEYN